MKASPRTGVAGDAVVITPSRIRCARIVLSRSLLSAAVSLTHSQIPSHPLCFPASVLRLDALLPSTGSGAATVPPLPRYYGGAKTARCPSRRASLPSLGDTMPAPAALLRCVPECCSAPARTLVCRRPSGSPVMETTSSPRFLGHPLRICPALRPRPGCHAKPFRHSSAAPADLTTKAPAIKFLSRLNHTASAVAVYASPGGRPRQTQDSLPAADYALPGGIGYPQGGYERFLMLVSHLPPPPGLAWRDRSQLTSQAARPYADSIPSSGTDTSVR